MYTNLLISLKNAQAVKRASIKVPFSKMNFEILKTLMKFGFVKDFKKIGRLPKRVIEIELNYDNDQGVIHGLKFISKPSRALYFSYRDLRPVRQGYGIGVVSTSRGILSDREARKMKVGGVYLFEIW